MTIFSNAVNKTTHYVFADGKLQVITFNYIEFEPSTQKYIIDAQIGGKHKRMEADCMPTLFDNEEDYRKENISEDITTDPTINNAKNVVGDTYNSDYLFYVADNNVKSISIDEIEYHYDYTDNTSFVGNEDIIYFTSRDLLMLCRDIKVVDAEGNETINKSLVSRLQLNDKQQALWENFISLTKEMEENNLSVIYDEDTEMMFAVGGDELTPLWRRRDKKSKSITMDSNAFADVMPRANGKAMSLYCCLSDSEEVYFYPTNKEA